MACVPLTEGDQPEMVPSSVAKMNAEVPVLPPLETWKLPLFPLKTTPVGAEVSLLPAGCGSVNVRGNLVIAPLLRGLTPVPLSGSHSGLFGEWAKPHWVTRLQFAASARPRPFA